MNDLYVNNCLFDSDIIIESPGVLGVSEVVFTDNSFNLSGLTVSAATFINSNISNNVGNGPFDINIGNRATDIVCSNNRMRDINISGLLDCSIVSGNTGRDIIFEDVVDSVISDNTVNLTTFLFLFLLG